MQDFIQLCDFTSYLKDTLKVNGEITSDSSELKDAEILFVLKISLNVPCQAHFRKIQLKE